MTDPHTVDIIMGTYNGARFLYEQLKSLQGQSYRNWRLIVRDDGSTDETCIILKRFAAEETRVQIVEDDLGNLGFGNNFRALLGMSKAPYTMFCDQDDVWLPCKVEVAVATAERIERSRPDAALLVHCDSKVVDSSLNTIQERFVGKRGAKTGLAALVFASCVQGSASLMNAKLRLHCMEIEPTLPHDFHAALIAEAMGTRVYIDEAMLLYRQHGGNSIGANVPVKSEFPAVPAVRSDLLASLHHGLEAAPHIRRILLFFRPRLSASVNHAVERYFYVLWGKSKMKRIFLILAENYSFSRRLDRLRFFVAIMAGIA